LFHEGEFYNIEVKVSFVEWHTGASGVTLYQGPPGSKFSKALLVEVPKARVERRICTSFLGGPGHMLTRKFLNLDSLKCHLLDFGERFYRILMVRKFWWSENDIVTYQRPPWLMFLLYSLSLGAPIWPIGVRGPRVRPVWTHSSYATDWCSPCVFHLCDQSTIPLIYSCLIIISPQSHVRRVLPVWLYQTPQVFSWYSSFLL
jgi:hypothetical protein